ncbi:MAG: hypothetical protein AAF557_07770 [Pseudomonadota bacterium]
MTDRNSLKSALSCSSAEGPKYGTFFTKDKIPELHIGFEELWSKGTRIQEFIGKIFNNVWRLIEDDEFEKELKICGALFLREYYIDIEEEDGGIVWHASIYRTHLCIHKCFWVHDHINSIYRRENLKRRAGNQSMKWISHCIKSNDLSEPIFIPSYSTLLGGTQWVN